MVGLKVVVVEKKLKLSQTTKKHGDSHTRLYIIWSSMKQRCHNSSCSSYKNYGGRGILVCKEWEDYLFFKDWALKNGYTENLTIDRINVNGNYCPENCRWITREEQLKNTTRTIFITYKEEKLCAMDWSKRLGIPHNVLIHRYKCGLPLDKVLSQSSFRGKNFKNNIGI